MYKLFCAVMLLLFLGGSIVAQNINKTVPKFTGGVNATVEYGFDGSTFKKLGQAGAIFDSMYVDTLATLSASETGFKIRKTTHTTAASSGFVIYNHSTSSMAIRMVPRIAGSANFYLPSGASTFYPFKVDSVYIKSVATMPDVEIQTGGVN